jgi:predicted Zn-dependent protease
MPKRFLYPIEIDNTSRLKRDIARGYETDIDQVEFLLQSAKNDFEKSISLDPLYGISHINLACVYDLMGKHLSAIAEIAEKLPKESFNTIGAQRILAIAYYNADMEVKAEEIWEKLKL